MCRILFLSSITALITLSNWACIDGPTPDPEPAVSPDPTPEDGTFQLVSWNSRGSTGEIEDGDDVELIAGFQGGYMIRPQLIVNPAAGYGEWEEFLVTLTHTPDPAAPNAFHISEEYQVLQRTPQTYLNNDGELVIGPFDDLLTLEFLEDEQLILEIRLQHSTIDTTLRRSIRLVAENYDESPCLPFAPGLGGGGCVYANVPGLFRVDARRDDTPVSGCTAPVRIQGIFSPDSERTAGIDACILDVPFVSDTLWQDTLNASGVYDADCLNGIDVVEGASVNASLEFEVEGTCSPGPFVLWEDPRITACECL